MMWMSFSAASSSPSPSFRMADVSKKSSFFMKSCFMQMLKRVFLSHFRKASIFCNFMGIGDLPVGRHCCGKRKSEAVSQNVLILIVYTNSYSLILILLFLLNLYLFPHRGLSFSLFSLLSSPLSQSQDDFYSLTISLTVKSLQISTPSTKSAVSSSSRPRSRISFFM